MPGTGSPRDVAERCPSVFLRKSLKPLGRQTGATALIDPATVVPVTTEGPVITIPNEILRTCLRRPLRFFVNFRCSQRVTRCTDSDLSCCDVMVRRHTFESSTISTP